MQNLLMIAGLMMLLALPPLFADPGGMYGVGTEKSRDSGMKKSAEMGMDKSMAPASITVSTPADGAKLSKADPVAVSYQATTGPNGDHVHIYVDGKREAVLRELAGSHVLGMLDPGMHKISVEVVTKDHQHIGVGKEVSVEVR